MSKTWNEKMKNVKVKVMRHESPFFQLQGIPKARKITSKKNKIKKDQPSFQLVYRAKTMVT